MASYIYNAEKVKKHHEDYELQKRATDIVFGIIDTDTRDRMHARSLSDEILASLEIEGENISYDSVYSSICKRLDVSLETKAKTDRYAEDISSLVLDATGNLEEFSTVRIKSWHSLLFSSMAGIKLGVLVSIGTVPYISAKELAEIPKSYMKAFLPIE